MAARKTKRALHPSAIRGRIEALKLREQGHSYRQIADLLGISVRAAWGRVQMALRALMQEPAEAVLKIETARLDTLYRLASMKAEKLGDAQAIDQCLRISIRRGKLLGLDAADKKEIKTVPSDPLMDIPPEMPAEAVRAVLEALLQWELDAGKKHRLQQALVAIGGKA